MCVVSVIYDYGRMNYDPNYWEKWIKPYQETIEAAKKLDEVTGQKDCETEEKTAWMKEIEEKLEKLEKRKKMEAEEVTIMDLIEEKRKLERQIFDLKSQNETLNVYLKNHNNVDIYQEKTRQTAIYPREHNIDAISYLALGLCGETGEVANKVKKIIRDKAGILSQEDKLQIKKEMGDTGWYWVRLIDELGFRVSEVMEENIKKLLDRKERGVISGSGDSR